MASRIVITDEMVAAFICSWFGLKPDDAWKKQDRYADAERALRAAFEAEETPDTAVQALRNIAEGNLGDAPWQANYAKIRAVALAALTPDTQP